MNILILTGKFGMGHYSVASALREQLTGSTDDHNVKIEDIFAYVLKKNSNIIYNSYAHLMKQGNHIYNIAYKITDNRTNYFHLTKHFLKALGNIVEKNQTEVIISTLPLCSLLASDYKRITGKKILLITCITDFYCHSDWLYPNTDVYLTASEYTKRYLVEKGISERCIFATGVPVREQFQPINQKNSGNNSRELLIMGGGFGFLPKAESFYRALNELPHIRTTIITGKNRFLFNLLRDQLPNIRALGYVDDVYRHMQQADLILTKPGGITLFEAIHTELPILMFSPVLEQEIRNETFITENRLGVTFSQSHPNPVSEIETIIHDRGLHGSIQENMRRFKSTLNKNALSELLDHRRYQVSDK